MSNQLNTSNKTLSMVYIALFTILIAICSWISIPAAVPFTLQTFGVFCCLSMLEGKRGTMAIFLYILLGTIGIPVFAGFKGGIGALFGTTGGYILGFLLTGLIYLLITRFFGKKTIIIVLAMVLGLIACYAFGTAWFMFLYTKNSGPIGLGTALSWCVFPFIIPDFIKLALALLISKRVKKYIAL